MCVFPIPGAKLKWYAEDDHQRPWIITSSLREAIDRVATVKLGRTVCRPARSLYPQLPQTQTSNRPLYYWNPGEQAFKDLLILFRLRWPAVLEACAKATFERRQLERVQAGRLKLRRL
jgi:hypothetical protein